MHGLPSHLSSFQPFLPVACERLAFAARPPDPSPLFPRLPALLSALPTFRRPFSHRSLVTIHGCGAEDRRQRHGRHGFDRAEILVFRNSKRLTRLTVRTAVSLRSALEAQGPA